MIHLENYLKTALSFAQELEIANNFSRFEYQNQPYQCGKNAEGFWLQAAANEKDTPACFEFDATLYDEEREKDLQEMAHELSKINERLQNAFPNLRLIEQDNYFKICIQYSDEEFLNPNFEFDCQLIMGAAKAEDIRMFRRSYETEL